MLIQELKHKPDIICITETWDVTSLNINLPNYKTPEVANRKDKRGGGVAIYVHEAHNHKRLDTNIINEHIELIGIEIQETAYFAIYRPPRGNKKIFTNKVIEIKQSKKWKEINFAGDFNIDITSEEYEELQEHQLLPVITKPTRITETTKTTIDNILTNTKTHTGYIIPCSISDHFITLKTSTHEHRKSKETIKIRNTSKEHVNNLINDLTNTNWEDILENNNTLEASSKLFEKLHTSYNTHIPFKEIKAKKTNNPWVTTAIANSMKQERKLYNKRIARNNHQAIQTHKEYKKILDKTIRKARTTHYQNKLKDNKSSKETWDVIYETAKQKKNKEELNDTIVINNKPTENKEEIANGFNTFFNQIGPKLAEKIQTDKTHKEFLQPHDWLHPFEFAYVTERELINTAKKLKPKASAGPDEISSKTLKQIIPAISKPLTHIINLSLETGIVHDELKNSHIIPIFKDGAADQINNHRPISLLNSISKVYEKIVHKQLYNYLTYNGILSKQQYGFRKNSSCEHAMIDLLATIEENQNNKEITNLTFIDLSKAFDTISHEILIDKLKNYGIGDTAANWFRNYLGNRVHQTKFKGQLSTTMISQTGVPQGSILGPLLFIIYINDLATTVNGTILYADDTTFITSNKCTQNLKTEVDEKLKIASDWFKANKLTLNEKKTRTMNISHKKETVNMQPEINNTKIKIITNNTDEEYFRFLGFLIDDRLTWKFHIKHVIDKLKKANYILAKTKNLYNAKTKKLIYTSLGQSYIEYGTPIWTNNQANTQILTLQKKMVRNIANLKYNAHTAETFKAMNILRATDLLQVTTCRTIKKTLKNLTPPRLRQIFKKEPSNRPQRYPNNIVVKNETSKTGHDLPKQWNKLPESLKDPTLTIKKFNTLLKETILNTYKTSKCNQNCRSCSK